MSLTSRPLLQQPYPALEGAFVDGLRAGVERLMDLKGGR